MDKIDSALHFSIARKSCLLSVSLFSFFTQSFAQESTPRQLVVLDTPPQQGGILSITNYKLPQMMGILEALKHIVGGDDVVKDYVKKGLFTPKGTKFYSVRVLADAERCRRFERARDFDYVVFGLEATVAAKLHQHRIVKHRGPGIVYGCSPVLADQCDGSKRMEIAIHRSRISSATWEICPSK